MYTHIRTFTYISLVCLFPDNQSYRYSPANSALEIVLAKENACYVHLSYVSLPYVANRSSTCVLAPTDTLHIHIHTFTYVYSHMYLQFAPLQISKVRYRPADSALEILLAKENACYVHLSYFSLPYVANRSSTCVLAPTDKISYM